MSELVRQYSASNEDIDNLIDVITSKQEEIKGFILENIKKKRLDIPDNVTITSKSSGCYIELKYGTLALIMVVHTNAYYKTGNRLHDRIHIKICRINGLSYKDYILIAKSRIYIDSSKHFMFNPDNSNNFIYGNALYFYAIFNAINEAFTLRGGMKNNKKINLKNYTIRELKQICKSKNIKNYSKLNKSDLIKLIKKNYYEKKL